MYGERMKMLRKERKVTIDYLVGRTDDPKD